MKSEWKPDSWKNYTAKFQPDWQDDDKTNKILEILDKRLPLVFSGEIEDLKSKLSLASEGKMFLLQGGDCAERFNPSLESITNMLKVLLQMNMVLMYGASKPVIKIGRFAGQYAKPRSKPTQEINNMVIPNYFGDIVNKPEATEKSRKFKPKNMLDAYNFSASTLNIVRSLSVGDFVDLHSVHKWNKEFIKDSPAGKQYEEIANGITKALDFMVACGIESPRTSRTDFYTSHEALILDYETPLVRQDENTKKYYSTSGHFLWVGDRTREPDGAHIEFLSGIENPIGIKCGPSLDKENLKSIISKLNPTNKTGKINLITRFGHDKIENYLPSLIETVTSEGFNVLWSSDPMHGNIEQTPNGFKTRDFSNILKELKLFFSIHKQMNTIPGGVHLELTGDEVTECIGGAEKLTESRLKENYLTACDPRLNAKQALEMAFLIAKEIV